MRDNAMRTEAVGNSHQAEDQGIDYHLRRAFSHLVLAVNQSVDLLLQNSRAKNEIGSKWETFLSQFFGYIRDKGKENRLNLLSIISFTKLRKW
ncbi:hypothetical protein [Ammoniphilus sp. 3BR4]|uniref:hypothetical protein n=1 Tax=Ammoniphilus sp. 3BR4 TaxID=3158265 RepID=UPI0034658BA7